MPTIRCTSRRPWRSRRFSRAISRRCSSCRPIRFPRRSPPASPPAPTHPATPYTPSGVSQPAVAPAASNCGRLRFAVVVVCGPSGAGSSAAPSFTAPAAYTPSPAPAAISHDTWADATAPAGPGTTARDITELIPASDLKAKHQPSDAAQALFNPDAPFSRRLGRARSTWRGCADDAPFAAWHTDAPFTLPAPAAQAAPKSKAKGKRPQLKVSRNDHPRGGRAGRRCGWRVLRLALRYRRPWVYARDGHPGGAVESGQECRCSSTGTITARHQRGSRCRLVRTFSSSAGAAYRASST